jgi:predicted component of type VI protein secretion system
MKRIALFFTLFTTLFLFSQCHKGPDNNRPNEVNLTVETDPANGIVMAPSIGPFNLKVTITSVIPPSGVKIEVNAKKDDGSNSAPYFTTSTNTSNAVTNFNITNTPSNVQCLVEIKVTSLTQSSNQWTGSYRYSRK